MIYILDQSTALSAQYLDDRALSRCIKSIAQSLCNVHWGIDIPGRPRLNIPLLFSLKTSTQQWSQWARESLANYDWLVKYGEECCREFEYRTTHKISENEYAAALHKMKHVIDWCRDNAPDLPRLTLPSYGPAVQFGEEIPAQTRIELPTPFPRNMTPKKVGLLHILGCNCETGEKCTIELYRSYYTHKLQKGFKKKISCTLCLSDPAKITCGGCGNTGFTYLIYYPQYTRREKPDWLDLNNKEKTNE